MDARRGEISSSVLLLLLALACHVAGAPGARLLAWAPLLFFAPGYMLTDLLFRTDRLAAVLTGVVLSLCLTIFGGLILGFFGQINPTGWSVWFSIMFCGCLLLRRLVAGDFPAPVYPAPADPASPRPVRNFLSVALAVSGLLTGGAYWIAMRSEAADSQFSFIEFWMLPSETPSELTLGVTNEEDRRQSFRIEVSTDGFTTAAWTTDPVAPGQTLQTRLSVSPKAQRVIARLFRAGDPLRVIRMVSRDATSPRTDEQAR